MILILISSERVNYLKLMFSKKAKKLTISKVRPSYDPSCAIFSSFHFMVIFNIESADSTGSQLKIAQLGIIIIKFIYSEKAT